MMKRFKWFALGVIAVTCFWIGMAIFRVITGELSVYQAFVDSVSVLAGLATITALGFAYVTYKNWSVPIINGRLEKCNELLLQRSKQLLDALTSLKNVNDENLMLWYNDMVIKDQYIYAEILTYLNLAKIDKKDIYLNERYLKIYIPKDLNQDSTEMKGEIDRDSVYRTIQEALRDTQRQKSFVNTELENIKGPSS